MNSNDVRHVWGSNRNFWRKIDLKIRCLGKFLYCKNIGLSYIKLNTMAANFRPNVPPEFLEAADETEFEGFRDDEIDNDDLSVNEYSIPVKVRVKKVPVKLKVKNLMKALINHNLLAHEQTHRGNRFVPVQIVNWSERLVTENIPALTENTGPANVLGKGKREVDFFCLLFPVGLLAWIVNETNRFAKQVQAVKGRDTCWTETNMDEICVFIGIRIYMSVVHLPDIKMYWSKDYLFGQFPIANIMTCDRFEKLSQYFHANDRTQYNRKKFTSISHCGTRCWPSSKSRGNNVMTRTIKRLITMFKL